MKKIFGLITTILALTFIGASAAPTYLIRGNVKAWDTTETRALKLIPDTLVTKEDATYKSIVSYNTTYGVTEIYADAIDNEEDLIINSKEYIFSSTINHLDTIIINASIYVTLDSLVAHINRDVASTFCTATRSAETITVTTTSPGAPFAISSIAELNFIITNIIPSHKRTEWHSYGPIVIKNYDNEDSVIVNSGYIEVDDSLRFKNNTLVSSYTLDLSGVIFKITKGQNFYFGTGAGEATEAVYSNFFGLLSGSDATVASYSNFSGFQSGYGATNASNSNFFGDRAGSGATDAHNSNFLGASAGKDAINANNSNFIGRYAGQDATTAPNSNFMGQYTGSGATNAMSSNFMGYKAGQGAINAKNSNFFGSYAGYSADDDSCGILMGRAAGYNATGSYLSAFGDSAGYGEDNSHVFIFGKRANATADSQFFIGGDIKYLVVPQTYSTLHGYADSSYRTDSLKYGLSYVSGASFLRSNVPDTATALSLTDTLRALSIVPYVPNTGQLGASGNAWNAVWTDTVKTSNITTTGHIYAFPLTSAYYFATGRVNAYSITVSGAGGPGKVGTTDCINSNGDTLGLYGAEAVGYAVSLGYASAGAATKGWTADSVNFVGKATGSSVSADTISGYNGNTWAVNSWGITITGIDTLAKFYMSGFDSTKFVRVWGNIKSVSSGGVADTLVYMDSLKTDSIKITIAVGAKWLAPAVINKKWPTNPGGVVNPVYCIFRKGATTAAANMQFFTAYGMAKGRVF